MAGFSSYDMVGIKEDISDVISNITPSDTPFTSAIKDEKIKNRTHQWQEDTLAAVNTTNYRIEGADASNVARVATSLRSNVTQILDDSFSVTGTAESVETYGRDKEQAYHLAKVSKQLKRDLEYMFVGKVQAAVVGDNSTARRLASVPSQIAAGVTTAGGTAALTEAMVVANNQLLYTAGGDADTLMIKPADATIIAGFAAISNQRIRDFGNDRKVVNAVDVYVSPFGEQRVKLNRYQSTAHAFLFSGSNWKKLVLRNWFKQPLAKTGDSENVQVLGEFSLKHRNYSASGMINALT